MILDIDIDDPKWQSLDLEQIAHRSVLAVLAQLDVPSQHAEVNVLACGDAQIAQLNSEFRGKATATNVLSWPAEDLTPPDLPAPDPDGTLSLGDIAISYETCQREAEAAKKSVDDHVTHLIVHGTLHLLGYDHEDDGDAVLMEGLETEILGNLGLSDPYSLD